MGKVTFPLTLKAGTWTSIELQLAASLDYEIMQVFVEHLASQKLPILSTNGATLSYHASNVDIATFLASYTHVILYKNAILSLGKRPYTWILPASSMFTLPSKPPLDIY